MIGRHTAARAILVCALVGCGSPHPTPPQVPPTTGIDPWAAGAATPHDAAVAVAPADAASAPTDSMATTAVTVPPRTPCPPRLNQGAGPIGASALDVWRSRAELPPCITGLVPPDIDFSREMLAGALPNIVYVVEIKQPATPPRRDKSRLIIEEQVVVECPPCRGVAEREVPRAAAPTTALWRIPAVQGVTVFHVVRSPLGARPCPPPVCG